MRIGRWGILLLTFVLAGCVGTIKGYPGPMLAFQDVAIVAGGKAAGGMGFSDVNEFVDIVAINASDQLEDWRGGSVHLLPGTYEFDVQYTQLSSSVLFGGLIQVGMDAARLAEAKKTRRRLRFDVTAGRTYVIQYDTKARQYAISDLYSTMWQPTAPVLAPVASSIRCVEPRLDDAASGCVVVSAH